MYDRTEPETYTEIDRCEAGVGWLAHPGEGAQRASHALRTADGEVWLFDPLDAPGLAELIDEFGSVGGVVVLSDYHARDADVLADRYGVSVHVPAWLTRIEDRLQCPVERFERTVAGFDVRPLRPLHAWHEGIAYRESDRTLYVPDFLSTVDKAIVGDERIGMPTLSRLTAPNEFLTDCEPDRILFGHGEGIFEGAAAALEHTLQGARRRTPRAIVSNLPTELRAYLGALR